MGVDMSSANKDSAFSRNGFNGCCPILFDMTHLFGEIGSVFKRMLSQVVDVLTKQVMELVRNVWGFVVGGKP